MVLNILLAIVGLIVGLGLGFVIAKSRHDKAINCFPFKRRSKIDYYEVNRRRVES